MKRKLNEHDVPDATVQATPARTPSNSTFAALQLDPRLLQGIEKQKFSSLTPIQANAIPLILEGNDVLGRSQTGSGKTAAYLLPILQLILKHKKDHNPTKSTSALILVPTRELASQVTGVARSLAVFCANDIRIENITREDDKVQRARLAESPDIVIATPGRTCVHLNNSALSLKNLTHLVIDEADLVLSYGYDDDLENISKSVPRGVQTILMSATLKTDLDVLKNLFCRDPVMLDIDEGKESNKVSQYVVKCGEDEKFLLIYAMFKLKLIKDKTIVFVGDIDRCYRLKLFLEQFGVKSCVLNSELPVNSRLHVVEEFNKNVYDIIIATDEHEVLGDEENITETAPEALGKENGHVNTNGHPDDPADAADAKKKPKPVKKKRRTSSRAKDFGVARGIDFKNVACVLNFDLPTSSKSYTHRIGRTARAGKTGMALSFIIPTELYRKHKPTSFPTCEYDEAVLAKITKAQEKRGQKVEEYAFDMKRLDGFRYRLGDALKAVTRIAIREARTRELRQELLKSEKLKRHFEENPEDMRHLRHDGELRAAKLRPHLRHVPDYLLPGGVQAVERDVGFVGLRKEETNREKKRRVLARRKGKTRVQKTRKADPLKTFNARGRGRKGAAL
ncbi:DEAD-domain-containing protein [Patellaria atrata CBS 101060]|uniref:RNA helicase n=1 Tax=Patellaria atrata CBS 101060 TaxID=1346257 RepID=A0A9P4SK14_9PEZI|nr:DEAD-domain-containing protein [Patellaria atrata CBS 101060]